jgi:hypothetical protein
MQPPVEILAAAAPAAVPPYADAHHRHQILSKQKYLQVRSVTHASTLP